MSLEKWRANRFPFCKLKSTISPAESVPTLNPPSRIVTPYRSSFLLQIIEGSSPPYNQWRRFFFRTIRGPFLSPLPSQR